MLSSRENVPPPSPAGKETPRALQQGAIGGKIAAMRERWDEQVQSSFRTDSTAKESPTLIHLKKTNEASVQREHQAKGSVYSKQRALERLHHEAKSRVEGVNGVAGGVSLWPAMDDMRLSKSDSMQLLCLCLVLMAATGTVFMTYHSRTKSSVICYTIILFTNSMYIHICFQIVQECILQRCITTVRCWVSSLPLTHSLWTEGKRCRMLRSSSGTMTC